MAKIKKSKSNEELDDEIDPASAEASAGEEAEEKDEKSEEKGDKEEKGEEKKSRAKAQEDGKHGDSNRGNVTQREMVTELKESYIDYAMSVIVARALPDVRDGLKPVHRRILYAMMQSGLRSNTKHRKSMAVVGEVLKSYHPHGDTAVYESLVRMAQDFNMRYTLVDGQGNFGSIDGDGAAAARYTECRLTKLGDEMLKDIEKDTVKFVDNYDGMTTEPTVLPSPLPQLLLNGSLGIAVGMATNIPPHNLTEVVDASIYVLEHPKAETEDLFEFVQGPDFPTGGIIYDQKEIITAYSQGKGAILMRGKADVVEKKDGAEQIIITEIPYQVLKSTLVEQMAELVSEKKVEGIKDIRDLSDREGMRIVIDVKKSYQPQRILNRLYKFTSLQKTFHLNLLALVDGIQPEILSLADVLKYFIKHREEVVTRRTQFDLEKAKERAHILEGLMIALKNIDAVIQTIKKSADKEEARANLIKKFKLTERQAVAILEMRLQTLAGLERKKIEDELKAILEAIKELLAILKSPEKLKAIIKKELLDIREKFGDKRKTKVVKGKLGEITEVDLVPLEETIITLTTGGYIKRINPATYKLQKRGGKGLMGMKTMQDDIVEHFLTASTHDNLMFFTDSGKVFQTQVYEIPEGNRVARGRGLLNFLEISNEEKVLSLIPMPSSAKATAGQARQQSGDKFLVMITKNGRIKKTDLSEFENVRKSGIIAIKLEKGDALKKVVKTTGEDDLILATKNGISIRFKEKDIRPMGRGAAGVKGISLKKGDEVIGMDVVSSSAEATADKGKKIKKYFLIVMENGYGKRTDIGQYKTQGRGGSGIKTAKITSKTGHIIMSAIVEDVAEEEDLIVISQQGQVIRTSIKSISLLGRDTQGVRIMRLDEGDKVASGACLKD
ncbi:MAG: DNA gyrase subunit A [Candidatus Staskawiczbacteria bacterium]|jgi:DNA gyrase subunit A